MDGFTFTRTLREHIDYKHLKIILFSSMSTPSNQLRAEQAKADELVANLIRIPFQTKS